MIISIKYYKKIASSFILLLLMGVFVSPDMSCAQDEVISSVDRYKKREYSTAYYEEYEAIPQLKLPVMGVAGVKRGVFPYSPFGAQVRNRSRLADSHIHIKFYENLRCEFCHVDQTKNIHTVRAGLTCRQCHGGEPIAGINHFYSPLNPIRRHAYVCAKCHQGASASFASYVVHEPPASSLSARRSFPLLFYSYWFMLLLLIGVMVFFLPVSLIGSLQEVAEKRGKRGIDIVAFFIPKKYRDSAISSISKKIGPAVDKFYSLETNDFTAELNNFFFLKPKAGLLKIKESIKSLFIKKENL